MPTNIPPCKLTTTVIDPATNEPYVIETVQGDGESLENFITRHFMAVSILHKRLHPSGGK